MPRARSRLGAVNELPSGAGFGNVVFNTAGNTAILDLNGNNTTINGLTQATLSTTNMVVNNLSGGTATLSVGNNNVTSTFNAALDDNTAAGGVLR